MSAANTTKPKPERKRRSFGPAFIVCIAFAAGAVLTSALWALRPSLPQALVAQVGTGTSLTAPITCATGDEIYQAAINGDETLKVAGDGLVDGDLIVTATASFAEDGTAGSVVVKAKARDKAPKPVVTSAYIWEPTITLDGQVDYRVVRYAIPEGVARVELRPTTGSTISPAATVFICAARAPR